MAWGGIVGFFGGIWDSIAESFKSSLGWVLDKLSAITGFVRGAGRSAAGIDDSTGDGAGGADAGSSAGSGVIPPEDRAARLMSQSISETISTERSMSEVTIKDETGRAEVTNQSGGGAPLKLQSSGAF